MRVFLLAASLCAMLCVPLNSALATTAKADADLNKTVDELLALMDGASKRMCMTSLDNMRKAGFTYQKQLIVPTDVDLACKSKGERNIIAGMRGTDWEYAFLFGESVHVDNRLNVHVAGNTFLPPPLRDEDWTKVQKNPGSRDSCEILVRHSIHFQRKLLEAARNNPALLEVLGARLYGEALETLYITSILVLAAEESHSLDSLTALHMVIFEHQEAILEVLLRSKHLGTHTRFQEQAALVKHVVKLLRKNKGQPSSKDLGQVLEIIKPERDYYLTPCSR